ncbi:putative protein 57 [Rhizopogon vesiculosus]|uniref:MARVEL domain-containing protein n=1 Tax=Rhizopogon vesiculosus TaxID=180088 RepID=A0A1J8QF92_9AGAM|nr:putative protein 57 [Rhizopogon vesiculosus]
MALFSTIRIGLFSFAIVFAIIELGINAYFLSLPGSGYLIFSVLGIATSLLTIITVPIMLIVDSVRREAFTSMIVVELVWLFILWVLWVATAAEAIAASNFYFPAGCIYATFDPTENAYCTELQAVEAFAFLNFIMFFVYTTVLLVFSIITSSRGKNVWTSSVRESTLLAPNSGPAQYQGYPTQYSGPPATGYNGTPVAQPQQFHSYNGVSA